MANAHQLPEGFCYLEDPRIQIHLAYLKKDNFLGRPVAGYHDNVCITTLAMAQNLIKVQDELDRLNKGYFLKIFDTYRPQKAVDDFQKWSRDLDTSTKHQYYPDYEKPDLFKVGFINSRSPHSRGAAVDLTIAQHNANRPEGHQELDMGTIMDFFGEASHTASELIGLRARENRDFFKRLMEQNGFKNFHLEWWHFNLADEPFPKTYFDFDVRC